MDFNICFFLISDLTFFGVENVIIVLCYREVKSMQSVPKICIDHMVFV